MNYRLLALDLDGTLLGPDGRVSEANIGAIARAQLAGTIVVPCTGRAWRESQNAVGAFRLHDKAPLGIFVTGATVTDLTTGASRDLAIIEPNMAMELVEFLFELPEAVLVLREPAMAGYDYLVCGEGELTHNTQRWFQANRATIRYVRRPTLDDLQHTLRVGIVGETPRVKKLAKRVNAVFGSRVLVHHFRAAEVAPSRTSMDVLEIFAAGVDKWRGLDWIARLHQITSEQIAFIGDEINDLSALRHAGCGIAMGNAEASIQDAADFVTKTNAQDGVAFAVDQLLEGKW